MRADEVYRCLERGLTQDVHYIDARIVRKDILSVSFGDYTFENMENSKECGASIRVFTKEGIGYCSVDCLSKEGVAEGIEKARKLAHLNRRHVPDFGVKRNVHTVDWTSMHSKNAQEVVTTLCELLESVEKPELSENMKNAFLCLILLTKQIFVNSEGSLVETMVPRTLITSTFYQSAGGTLHFLIKESIGSTTLLKIENEIPPLLEYVHERVKTARAAKKGTPVRSPSDIVFDCSAAGMILHEAVGHALEADAILEGASPFISDIGKKIAPENITVVDDATAKGEYGSYPYDADGYSAEKKVLIENGMLKNYLVDLECGLALGMDPNGSGRVGGFSGFPIPRSSNTYVQGGDWDNDEILEESHNCIYVKTPSAAQISPDKTNFFMESYDAYILDGDSAKLIKNGIKVFFDTRDLLNKITALGNTVKFFPTVCMKERQVVPVSVGAPVMKLADVLHLCSG